MLLQEAQDGEHLGALQGAALQWGQDGGKQMRRTRTFPGVRFSWKGACLELTSHGIKQQLAQKQTEKFVLLKASAWREEVTRWMYFTLQRLLLRGALGNSP